MERWRQPATAANEVSEDAEGYRAAEHPTGSKSQMRPGEKNAYNGEDAACEFCEMSYNFEIQQDLYDYLRRKKFFFTQKSYIFQVTVKLYDTNWLKAYFQ